MTDAILIFTFGPIQPFIAEARRPSDLYAGSQILVRLARAIGTAIGENRLIYPATLQGDTPNRLVARVPWREAKNVARGAQEALIKEWKCLARPSKEYFEHHGPVPDSTWQEIWSRQTDHQWECYWAAAELPVPEDYKNAYDKCCRALDAVKRTRAFEQCEEAGEKDTLSGRRSALRVRDMKARAYWQAVSESGVHAATLRPDGRERLDALGAIKRFGDVARPFASVSSVASRPFLKVAIATARSALDEYRNALESLLDDKLYQVRYDPVWPYNGDLLFKEALTQGALRDSYGAQALGAAALQGAVTKLRRLCEAAGAAPCPYYAIVLLDGDNIGQRIASCQTENEHRSFSHSLSKFAASVHGMVDTHLGTSIYEGGDDVLALAPLESAIPLAQALARAFREGTTGTASAGVAAVHHRYPLDAALRAARETEREAKSAGRKAVAFRIIKRSGEGVSVHSSWEAMGDTFNELVGWFQTRAISSQFAYDLAASAYALRPGEMFRAELKRLAARHRDSENIDAPDPQALAERLNDWGGRLPVEERERASTLAGWVLAARFVAQGGGQ